MFNEFRHLVRQSERVDYMQKNYKPTIKDVAKLANVSTATVERALTNRGSIRNETKEQVLRAVNELGYSTNAVAKALQRGRSATILTVYHTTPEYFTEDFRRGFEDAAANLHSRGLELVTLRTKSLDPKDAIETLRGTDFSNIDAVLIDCGGAELDACIQSIVARGMPVATFGSDSASSGRAFYVGEDPLVSGRVAGEIAGKMAGGKGNFVVFHGAADVDALNARTAGFEEVIRRDFPGITMLPAVSHNDEDVLAIRGAIRILTGAEKIDGVFCNSAGGLMALYRAIQYLDLRKDQTPIILGYDFNAQIMQMLQEDYCTMAIFQNPYQQAYNALNYMFDYITENVIPPNALNYVPCDLVFKYNAHMFVNKSIMDGCVELKLDQNGLI